MRKTDKKLERQIAKALTDVCTIALEEYQGFVWLTHLVDYNRFPGSLEVVCVFETNADLTQARANNCEERLPALVSEKLASIDLNLRDGRQHVRFDTEQNCEQEHNGRWNVRFSERAPYSAGQQGNSKRLH